MEKIYDKIYPLEPDEMDNLIYKNCILLSWIEPKHIIERKTKYINYDNFLTDMFKYFDKIEKEKSPRKKLINLSQIFISIENFYKSNNEINSYGEMRVDDQFQILCYLFIKSHPLNIYTNCKFMDLFLDAKTNKVEESQLFQSKGICEFMSNIKSIYLNKVTEEDFNKNCFIASHNDE